MRSQLLTTLIAVAVASTLTACASGNRDANADTAAVDTSMSSPSTMDQGGSASVAPATDAYNRQNVADSTQMGASTTAQTGTSETQMASQQYPSQTTASATQMDRSQDQAGTMSTQAGMDGQLSAAGAMKTEIVEGSQMGASTGGMTASGMDQQAVCGMYAQLKSASSTAEREKVMTQILLNVPRGDSALVDVREQCASAAP